MSGVWMFKDGIARLVPNPLAETSEDGQPCACIRRKVPVLVHCPTNRVVTSHRELGDMLMDLGWEPYPSTDPNLLQYHQSATPYLISLPADFTKMKTMHMFDIVVKTRAIFEVRDSIPAQ